MPGPDSAGDSRAQPAMSIAKEGPKGAGLAPGLTGSRQRGTAIAITAYAVAVPLVLSLIELVRTDPPLVVMVWLAMLILGPAIAAAIAVLQGAGGNRARHCRESRNSEAQQNRRPSVFPGRGSPLSRRTRGIRGRTRSPDVAAGHRHRRRPGMLAPIHSSDDAAGAVADAALGRDF